MGIAGFAYCASLACEGVFRGLYRLNRPQTASKNADVTGYAGHETKHSTEELGEQHALLLRIVGRQYDRAGFPAMRDDQRMGLFLPQHLRSLGQALTVAEVAELLKVSERHVYHLVQSGVMPHFKVGSAVRFDPDTLGDWLQKVMDGNRMAIFNEKKLLKGKKEPGLLDDGKKG